MWYRFLDMVWLFLLAISWESKEFAHPQLLEAMTSPEFRILRVLALSHDVLRECFFCLVEQWYRTTDYPCKVERLETTLHQLKISLFWPLKMLGINSLPGFVFFYRKGFHLLCRRKPVKNSPWPPWLIYPKNTRSWDHCGRDGAFALRIHEGLVEFWATMWCGSARFWERCSPRPFQIFCLPQNFQLLDIAIAQQQKLPSQLVGAILRVCGYKNWD